MSKRFEIYWNDLFGDKRGIKCEDESVARGFIWGLRKDGRNTMICGYDTELDRNLNTDEHGEPCDHLGPFPVVKGRA